LEQSDDNFRRALNGLLADTRKQTPKPHPPFEPVTVMKSYIVCGRDSLAAGVHVRLLFQHQNRILLAVHAHTQKRLAVIEPHEMTMVSRKLLKAYPDDGRLRDIANGKSNNNVLPAAHVIMTMAYNISARGKQDSILLKMDCPTLLKCIEVWLEEEGDLDACVAAMKLYAQERRDAEYTATRMCEGDDTSVPEVEAETKSAAKTAVSKANTAAVKETVVEKKSTGAAADAAAGAKGAAAGAKGAATAKDAEAAASAAAAGDLSTPKGAKKEETVTPKSAVAGGKGAAVVEAVESSKRKTAAQVDKSTQGAVAGGGSAAGVLNEADQSSDEEPH